MSPATNRDESLSYSSSISHNSKDSTNLFSSRYDWSSSIPFGMGSSFLKQCIRWSSDPSKFVFCIDGFSFTFEY
ncbi:hypothetical protein BLOT_005588 [Blomia tropicalis]|nr:hypothetical protein BLOT_005588 [Blomia tropicalis]